MNPHNPKQKNPKPSPQYYDPSAVKWVIGQLHGEDAALIEANEKTKQKHLQFHREKKKKNDRTIAHGYL